MLSENSFVERAMPLRQYFAFLLMLFVSAIGTENLLASPKFQPVSPEELKMTSDPQAPGAAALLLFRQVDRDDNGMTSHEDNYFRIKILTEEGRKYADVEIPLFKEEGDITNIRARTIRPDGSIANFDGKVFTKEIAKAKGLKYIAKTFTLPDVQVGGIIEYYYTIDMVEHYIYNSRWILSNELFTQNAKFSLKPYQSDMNQFRLRWSWNWLPAGSVPPKEGPDRLIRFSASNIPAFKTEDFMPPENELKSRVDFIYSEDYQETDSAKYWKKAGKKLNDHLESFLGRRQSLDQALSQIVKPEDAPEIKAQKIYSRVQQIRNTSYEVQKSEQEQKRDKEKDLTKAEDVWKRGYGNGQQLTWLYLALVRSAGIESYGVWASDRNHYFFDPRSMDSHRLDSNVVLLKLNGKDIYCDPGAAFTPFGMLPWVETGITGLRLDKDGGTWVKTTLPDSSESRITNKATLKLTETGSLEGNLQITFTGLQALQRRVEERNQDDTERQKFLEDEVREFIPAAIEVELTNKPAWGSSDRALIAEFNLKVPGWAAGAGHRALISVGVFSAAEKRLFEHGDRVHPIYFEYPFENVDDVSVELPAGWKVTSLPPAKDKTGHIISYTLKTEDDKGKIHVARDLNLNFLLLETKYYPALRTFFQEVRSGDEEQIVLQPGTASASN